MRRIRPLNRYSCSPPGVGAVSVAPSVMLFLCELFLPRSFDGLAVPFGEALALSADAVALGEAVGFGETVAVGVALGEALAVGAV